MCSVCKGERSASETILGDSRTKLITLNRSHGGGKLCMEASLETWRMNGKLAKGQSRLQVLEEHHTDRVAEYVGPCNAN